MVHKLSSVMVICYFSGEDTLLEVFFEGSNDELVMDNETEDDTERDFEIIKQGMYTE